MEEKQTTKIKVTEVVGLKNSAQFKDMWHHDYYCFAEVGGAKAKCVVIIWSKSEVPPGFEAGEHEVEVKPDYKGEKQFKLVKPKKEWSGGSFKPSNTGYTPRSSSGRNETSIVAQSSLKAAIEFVTVTNIKATPEDVIKVAEEFMAWVQSKS